MAAKKDKRKDGAKRQSDFRQRRKDAGLIERKVWFHPSREAEWLEANRPFVVEAEEILFQAELAAKKNED